MIYTLLLFKMYFYYFILFDKYLVPFKIQSLLYQKNVFAAKQTNIKQIDLQLISIPHHQPMSLLQMALFFTRPGSLINTMLQYHLFTGAHMACKHSLATMASCI